MLFFLLDLHACYLVGSNAGSAAGRIARLASDCLLSCWFVMTFDNIFIMLHVTYVTSNIFTCHFKYFLTFILQSNPNLRLTASLIDNAGL